MFESLFMSLFATRDPYIVLRLIVFKEKKHKRRGKRRKEGRIKGK